MSQIESPSRGFSACAFRTRPAVVDGLYEGDRLTPGRFSDHQGGMKSEAHGAKRVNSWPLQ
jgi:hypothetical protein